MKLSKIFFLIVTGFLVYSAITNPKEEKFNEFISKNANNSLKEKICNSDQSQDLLTQLKSLTCNFVADQTSGAIEDFFSKNTVRNNYIIFSIYQINTPIYQSQTLGIFNKFIVLNSNYKEN